MVPLEPIAWGSLTGPCPSLRTFPRAFAPKWQGDGIAQRFPRSGKHGGTVFAPLSESPLGLRARLFGRSESQRCGLRLFEYEDAPLLLALPLHVLEMEHVEAKLAAETALVAHEEHELLLVRDEAVHRPAVDEVQIPIEGFFLEFAAIVHGTYGEVCWDVALAVADLLAFVADEAAEAPGDEGDALGVDLLQVAVGFEVVEDAGAVGEPLGLALDLGEDGRDGVDAVGGGVVAGDGFAFCGPGSA